MHERARPETLGRQQLGHAVVGVWIGRVDLQHPAPDLERLCALAQLLERPGVSLPGLDLGGVGLCDGLEMLGCLGEAPLHRQQRGQPLVRLQVLRQQRQDAPPGVGLA